jgi:hypothetical protein
VLEIESLDSRVSICGVLLDCQVRIEARRRRYAAAEHARLAELFGEPARWGVTMKDLLWAYASIKVPAFDGMTGVRLPIPCSFDFNLGATRYLDGLVEGEVPLVFLFSGTVFYDDAGGLKQAQIPWTAEARYRMPVSVWREMSAHFYPDSAWVPLPHALVDRLGRYRREHGMPTLELAIERLLDERTHEIA